MRDERQRIHLIAVQEHIDLHQLAYAVAGELIVERGVALGVRLERVEKVVDDLIERHLIVHLHKERVEILHILELTAPLLTHRHDVAHVVRRCDDRHLDVRFLGVLDDAVIGIVVRVIDAHHRAVGLVDLVDDARQRRDEVEVELALQALLDDLHVQHPEEAAAETEAERHGGLRLERERCIV